MKKLLLSMLVLMTAATASAIMGGGGRAQPCTERQELLGTAETGGLPEGAERPAGRDTGHDAQGQLRHLQL